MDKNSKRTIGLLGATGVGVGAIVGGGILALSGVAFALSGPSAILAFGFNGIIAIIIAASFAEMSSMFPESGGTYLFSKKVLSIESAFIVGWIVWFASILASVLYAIGFASFFVIGLNVVLTDYFKVSLPWLNSIWAVNLIAVAAVSFYALSLSFRNSGSGPWLNFGKLFVFAVIIASGLYALTGKSPFEISEGLTPFFSDGYTGMLKAMGYTFIALQGFDLISAVGGEIKNPEKNIPRSIFLSLGVTLLIYIPLLFIISTVGVGTSGTVTQMGKQYMEAVIVVGVKNYIGDFGYWLVLVAALLSMLSALNANIFASSRIALKMAEDRTLPKNIGTLNNRFNTPLNSIVFTSAIIILVVLTISNVESAGAAASLIFLISFSIAQLLAIIIRNRTDAAKIPYKMPFYPVLPVVGIICCLLLAVFQGFTVPLAGFIILTWMLLGGILYIILFSKSAKVADASAEGFDPQLSVLRGHRPLVLVPVSNPANASSMVTVASAIVPPDYGKVQLLSVITPPENESGEINREINNNRLIMNESLKRSFSEGLYPEVLTTVADNVWTEIKRVSISSNCSSLLLGLTNLSEKLDGSELENLINEVSCDVVVLKAPPEWKFGEVKKVLIPVAGNSEHGELLARVIGTLTRIGNPAIEFIQILPEYSSWEKCEKARLDIFKTADDFMQNGNFTVKIIKRDNVVDEIVSRSLEFDLVILGFRRVGKYLKAFGSLTQQIVKNTDTPIILISRSGK